MKEKLPRLRPVSCRSSFGRRTGRPTRIVCAALVGVLLTARIPTAEGQVPPVATPQPAATPISVNGSRPSEPLLRQAATAVESQSSLRAMLRLKAQILDNELVGSGLYLQQGRGVEMLTRLELRLQTGDEATGLLRINDGRYVWTDRRSGSQRWVTSVDLGRLREAGQGGEGGAGKSVATDVATPQFELVGGLTDLLNSLEATFQFGDAQPNRIGKLPVYQLTGTWRPFMLARFLPDQADAILAGQPANLDTLPGHIPTEVVLLLGHDNLFPYVIDYRRGRHRSLLRIEWYEIQFGGTIDPKRFVFHSRGEGAKDITDQVIQRRVALRRMERK